MTDQRERIEVKPIEFYGKNYFFTLSEGGSIPNDKLEEVRVAIENILNEKVIKETQY